MGFNSAFKGINGRRLELQKQLEEDYTRIIVKWAQEDV
jgi:hypothetical protein